MALNTQAIIDAVCSYAEATGYYDRVQAHEPKSAPGNGLNAAVWVDSVRPIPQRSGLAKTSAVLALNLRIYQNMLSEPQDAIDPNVTIACDALMNAVTGGFTLGGAVSEVDLLGEYGQPLGAQAGYLQQDNRLYRAVTVTIPVVINDCWDQSQ